jgi:hypothetical protein
VEVPVAKKLRSPEHDDRELATDEKARLLEIMATVPEGDVRRTAAAEGFPMRVVDKFIRRMRTRHVGTAEAVKAFGHGEMLHALGEKMTLALQAMTPEKMADSPARDLAVVFGILAEKRELLQGKPTQIFSFEERRSMKELLPAAIREAQRRGFVIDGTYTEDSSVEPRVISETVKEQVFNKTAPFMDKLPTERKG